MIARLLGPFRQLFGFYLLQVRLIATWRTGPGGLLRRALVSFVTSFLALAAAVAAVPGITTTGVIPICLGVVVMGALNALVRPVIIYLVSNISVVLVGVLAIVLQVVVIQALGLLVPGLDVADPLSAALGALVFVVVYALVGFAVSLDQFDSYYGSLVRLMTARSRDVISTDEPGVVIVQLDGVAHPVLSRQIRAGRVPTISRWIRSGRMRLADWDVLVPSQTSASQAGILHGRNDTIAAFRWWEKSTQRLLVSSRPDDALEMERRVSDGHGLLAANGTSIGNLLTGDAVRCYLTMAALRDPHQGIGQSRGFFAFFFSPHTYINALVLTVAEAIKEVIQATRQRRRGIEPRLDRGFPYPLARAATNVLLRSVSTALAVEEMYRGTPIIYVDYPDYDEIAHHSGPERPESLDALDGLDAVLGLLDRAARDTPRPYRFIALSDHGQTLGATFRQRYGEALAELVRRLMGESAERPISAIVSPAAPTGPFQINALATEVAKSEGVTASVSRRLLAKRTSEGYVDLGRRRSDRTLPSQEPSRTPEGVLPPELVVCASGNLAYVYFPRLPGRATREEIDELYPELIPGLAAHPGIGFILVRTESDGTVILARNGRRRLDGERSEGRDPLIGYGPHAIEGLRRIDAMEGCGDLTLISLFEPSVGEVAAFEELIGSHGGLGGFQTRAFLLHPADWEARELVGSPAVHRQIRAWLVGAGLIQEADPAPSASEEPAPARREPAATASR